MVAVAALTMSLASLVYAQNTVNIYSWTDKPHYEPGEKGVLHLVIRNDRADADLIIDNITIMYPWFAYTGEKWEGNDTIVLEKVLPKNGGQHSESIEFNIPNDGRITNAYSSTMQIKLMVAVDKYPYEYTNYASIYVKTTPIYMSLENINEIVTLFTIQIVLVIVCTIIIAATIFLSARRPQVTWRHEEKVE